MKKKTRKDTLPKAMQEALNAFPRHVAKKKRDYEQRQKFLKETFGDLVRRVRKEMAREGY